MEDFSDITWFGHASFAFTDKNSGNRIYYVDPFKLPQKDLEKADIVFITHAHYDHLSENDINHILKDDTVVVATPDSLSNLKIPEAQKFAVKPNKKYTVRDFPFETVPAYNTAPERQEFHPKSNNWVGYIFSINSKKIYQAGDTDFIPEMNDFKKFNLDIAFLPMGGHYVMDVDEMIKAANAIGAKVTIPMHYKALLKEKTKAAEEKLKTGLINSKAVILEELR